MIKIGLFELIDAFQKVLSGLSAEARIDLTAETISVKERITEIADQLEAKGSLTFFELFSEHPTREREAGTRVAAIELRERREGPGDAGVLLSQPLLPDLERPVEQRLGVGVLLLPEETAAEQAPGVENPPSRSFWRGCCRLLQASCGYSIATFRHPKERTLCGGGWGWCFRTPTSSYSTLPCLTK